MLSLLENESGACRGSTSFPRESFEKGINTRNRVCGFFLLLFFLNSWLKAKPLLYQNENKRAVKRRRGGVPRARHSPGRGPGAHRWGTGGARPRLAPSRGCRRPLTAGPGRAGRGGRLSCGAPHMTGAPSPAGKGSERRRRRMAAGWGWGRGWGRALLPPAALLVLAPLVLAPDPVSPRARRGPAEARRGCWGDGDGHGAAAPSFSFVVTGVGWLWWQAALWRRWSLVLVFIGLDLRAPHPPCCCCGVISCK